MAAGQKAAPDWDREMKGRTKAWNDDVFRKNAVPWKNLSTSVMVEEGDFPLKSISGADAEFEAGSRIGDTRSDAGSKSLEELRQRLLSRLAGAPGDKLVDVTRQALALSNDKVDSATGVGQRGVASDAKFDNHTAADGMMFTNKLFGTGFVAGADALGDDVRSGLGSADANVKSLIRDL